MSDTYEQAEKIASGEHVPFQGSYEVDFAAAFLSERRAREEAERERDDILCRYDAEHFRAQEAEDERDHLKAAEARAVEAERGRDIEREAHRLTMLDGCIALARADRLEAALQGLVEPCEIWLREDAAAATSGGDADAIDAAKATIRAVISAVSDPGRAWVARDILDDRSADAQETNQ